MPPAAQRTPPLGFISAHTSSPQDSFTLAPPPLNPRPPTVLHSQGWESWPPHRRSSVGRPRKPRRPQRCWGLAGAQEEARPRPWWSIRESRLCTFCGCSLSELVLSPTFLLQIGHAFTSGRLCCRSIGTFPWSFLSRASRALAKPLFGCARRWTFFSKFQALQGWSPWNNGKKFQ
jgi:hypothetical protein